MRPWTKTKQLLFKISKKKNNNNNLRSKHVVVRRHIHRTFREFFFYISCMTETNLYIFYFTYFGGNDTHTPFSEVKLFSSVLEKIFVSIYAHEIRVYMETKSLPDARRNEIFIIFFFYKNKKICLQRKYTSLFYYLHLINNMT